VDIWPIFQKNQKPLNHHFKKISFLEKKISSILKFVKRRKKKTRSIPVGFTAWNFQGCGGISLFGTFLDSAA
jgi:hypothetical protein